jgi:glycerol kinase
MNTGEAPVRSNNNLITTVAWRVDGKPVYTLEGSVFVGGAVVQWLRDELGLIKTAAETEAVAQEVADNGGVYFVPAFTGLGAPHWDMYSRGTLVGLTRGANRAHIVRAALESIAYQSADVIEAMESDAGIKTVALRVDGGASANSFLMQFQADLMNADVIRPQVIETTAMGAAMLAGRAVGLWTDGDLRNLQSVDREFIPAMDERQRAQLLRHWHRAVERSKGWAEE